MKLIFDASNLCTDICKTIFAFLKTLISPCEVDQSGKRWRTRNNPGPENLRKSTSLSRARSVRFDSRYYFDQRKLQGIWFITAHCSTSKRGKGKGNTFWYLLFWVEWQIRRDYGRKDPRRIHFPRQDSVRKDYGKKGVLLFHDKILFRKNYRRK